MEKKIAFLLFLFAFSQSIAKDLNRVVILTKKGSEIEADVVVFENAIINTQRLRYFQGGKKKFISLLEIQSIQKDDDTYEVIWYKKKRTTGPNRSTGSKEPLLAKVIIKDSVSLYKVYRKFVYNNEYTRGVALAIDTYLKRNRNVAMISHIGFKKSINKFYSDCLDIVSKVEDGELKWERLETLVSLGNKNCK